MRIKIVRPYLEHPLVWLHVSTDTDPECVGVLGVLEDRRITLLGPWEKNVVDGIAEGSKAPALLEDDHTKPRKKGKAKWPLHWDSEK